MPKGKKKKKLMPYAEMEGGKVEQRKRKPGESIREFAARSPAAPNTANDRRQQTRQLEKNKKGKK